MRMNYTSLRPLLLVGVSVTSALAAVSTGRAQGAGAVLEEIIVTAEKRAENVQKTAVAVSAVSNDDLVRAGALQLENIGKMIPDIKLDRQGPVGMTVGIRGVSSTDNSPTAEAANAVHLNGAYLAKTTALQGHLYDLERVEVAKGPQGTLYGRNANGGTINIITNKPKLGEQSATGELEIGNYNLLRTTGAANVAVNDTLALRIAAQSYAHKGYMKSGLDDANEKGGRLSLMWQPSDEQSLWVVVDSTIIGGKGPGNNAVDKIAGTDARIVIPTDPRDDVFFASDTSSGKAEVYGIDSTNTGITAQYDQGFDRFTWTTEAAWRRFNSAAIGEANLGSGDNSPPFAVFPTSVEFLKASRTSTAQHFTSVSLESRLTSATTTPLQWVAGVYGFRNEDGGTLIAYGNMRTPTPSLEVANGAETATSFAGFGQVVYTPTALDALHITAGGRYTRDKKEVSGIFTRFGTAAVTPLTPASKTWSASTYKLGVSYDVAEANLLYANVSTGYKAGGYGYGPGTTSEGPVYKPERITAYEVGSKNRFLNDRLQVNLEGYYYKYRDFQTNLSLFPVAVGSAVLTVSTAGKATYKGGAIDIQFAATDVDLLKTTFSVLNAKYGEYLINAPAGYTVGVFGPTTSDKSGQDIANAPKWSGVASYSHTFKLAGGSAWDAQVAANFRGPTTFEIKDDPSGVPSPTAAEPTRRELTLKDTSWAMFDVSLKYTAADSAWAVTGYVRNLADADHPVFGTFAQSGLMTETFYAPRTFGAIFSLRIK